MMGATHGITADLSYPRHLLVARVNIELFCAIDGKKALSYLARTRLPTTRGTKRRGELIGSGHHL